MTSNPLSTSLRNLLSLVKGPLWLKLGDTYNQTLPDMTDMYFQPLTLITECGKQKGELYCPLETNYSNLDRFGIPLGDST